MSDYDYVAIDVAGKERRGRLKAKSREEAHAALVNRKYYVVRVEAGAAHETPAPSLVSTIRLGFSSMSGKQMTLFTRQLATLASVTPLEEALRTIALQTEQPHVRAIISNIHAGVFEGRRLADAMAREPRSFSALYRAMVSAGESTGTLPVILERLSVLLERQAIVRSKVISALAYPVILAIVAMFVVAALLIFVIPKVVEQFDTVGQQLPLLTRMVIGLSEFLANWWWLLILLFTISGVGLWHALKNPVIRLNFDRWLLRLPLIGRMTRDLHAARMARTLATMVASRLPLYEGIMLTIPTIHNRALRSASEEVAESIRGGGGLSAALKRSGVFPPLLVYLSASGESSGQLEMMLERAADYLEREFDGFTNTALSMLEPLIIVIMGATVAAIVLAILLPILQLESLAGGI